MKKLSKQKNIELHRKESEAVSMKKKFYVGQVVYLYLIGDAAENKKVSERIKTCEVLYVLDGKNITVQPEGSTHKWVLGIESDLCGSQEVNRFNGADYLLYLSKEEIIDRIAQKYGYKKRVENCIVLGIITEYVKDRHVVTASRVGCAERWYKDIDEVIEEIKEGKEGLPDYEMEFRKMFPSL